MSRTAQKLLPLWLKTVAGNRFDRATRQPKAAQERKLLEIVRRNEGTAFGLAHDFRRIRSAADFQARVPPQSYATLTPYIDRMMRGEGNLLTADEPLMYATTSGTTGRSKYIPVTPSYLAEYTHGMNVHHHRVFTDYGDILAGKILVSSSSDTEGLTDGGTPFGAISGYVTRHQPGVIKRFYVLPYEVCRMKDVEQKYYVTLLFALAADVRMIVTPNPSSLLLLADKLDSFGERLIRDLRAGTIDRAFLPDHVASGLLARVRANPRRADELEGLARVAGSLRPADVWQNLRLISCWKGGTMPLYLRKLPDVFGDVPVRDLGYMASEGRGATALTDSGAGAVPNLTSHFFEFVPVEQRDSPSAEFLTVDELEANREYFVYFTTSAGLYRYDVNDVVRVVDVYRDTPVIQFVRKGQGITSITGEKLTESQVTGALVEVVDEMGCDVRHFTAAVEWGEPPRYALYVEAGDSMTSAQAQEFASRIDRSLFRRNEEYQTKRESQRLGPPLLKRVAPGTYQALRQRRIAEGASEAQVKIPQLSTSMTFGEGLHVLEEIAA
jgi:hypothetical protein